MNEKEKNANDFFFGLTPLPDDTAVTIAYVPFQTDRAMYDEETALKNGTLFTALNKTFCRGALK